MVRLTLRDGSVLDGDLVCPLAGDAYCDDATVQVTGNAVCEHCSTPAAPLSAAAVIGTRDAHRFPRPTVPVIEP